MAKDNCSKVKHSGRLCSSVRMPLSNIFCTWIVMTLFFHSPCFVSTDVFASVSSNTHSCSTLCTSQNCPEDGADGHRNVGKNKKKVVKKVSSSSDVRVPTWWSYSRIFCTSERLLSISAHRSQTMAIVSSSKFKFWLIMPPKTTLRTLIWRLIFFSPATLTNLNTIHRVHYLQCAEEHGR